ncbi:uncharacterized protein LOC127711732 [Mytilus californianus]|uniref:uncharacterized protein LOC127711732 n=1 Tax=Mytilus californianus TaxID=6549 RepID=UPI002246F158|nr:uncharacterized protein LOC127711732 [Mytilus californianus]
MTLTDKYVNEQFKEVEQLKSQDKNNNVPQVIPNNQDNFSSHTPAPRNQFNINPTPRNLPKFEVDNLDLSIAEDIKSEIQQKQTLNPCAADFEFTQPPLPPKHDQSVVSDLTKFLLKKDLLLTRFQNFDDCAETYASWKATFKSITEELSVTAFEEMDLIVKWLGRESSKFLQTIRASNVNNPKTGLRRIWERLDERYGRPEMVEATIKTKLQKFPKLTNKDHSRLYELLDILTQIESSKENETFSNLLSYFDSSSGVLPIVDKLPYNIQEKWTTRASQYKLKNNVPFPPFSYFVQFIREVCAVKNDPAFIYSNTEASYSRKTNDTRKVNHGATSVFNRKTDVNIKQNEEKEAVRCPIHKANHHLNTCRAFKAMTYEERRKYLKDNKICFKCCHSTTHMSRNCTVTVKCEHCGSNYHITAMHLSAKSSSPDGGEKSSETTQNANDHTVSSKCTSLCGFSGKSCGKTIQVRVYPKNFPDKAVYVYAILDDQSNRTLAKTELFDQLGINTSAIQYTMSSCAGRTIMNGRCAESLIVESLSGNGKLETPSVIECSAIPDEKSEIPTPDIAKSYPHLREIAHQMLDLNPNIDIQLLIGRDVPEAHHVNRQLTGPKGTPFAQELFFGWVIKGDVCLGKVHKPNFVNVNKSNVMNNGRGTIFEPCINTLYVKENTELAHIRDNVHSQRCNNDPLFIKTKDDDKIGTSVEDRLFLNLMDSEWMIGVTRRILDAVILTSSSKSLTHESLTTFLAEVTAIINARPIAQISSDPEMPLIISPSMLLTGKQDYLPVITDTYNLKDMYHAQWKHVQVLSDIFWKHWRSDYLQCLQQRRKWHVDKDNIKVGDVILMRDKSVYRGEWPLGIVEEVIKSDDEKVRKARLRIYKEGKAVTYTRPISEMVLLVD